MASAGPLIISFGRKRRRGAAWDPAREVAFVVPAGQYHRTGVTRRSEPVRDGEPIHVGQHHVQQDDVRGQSRDQVDRGGAGGRLADDPPPGRGQPLGHRLPEPGVIIDNNQRALRGL